MRARLLSAVALLGVCVAFVANPPIYAEDKVANTSIEPLGRVIVYIDGETLTKVCLCWGFKLQGLTWSFRLEGSRSRAPASSRCLN